MNDLVERCRSGDPSGWQALIEQTSRLVYGIASKFDLSREEIEDVVQETYLALFRSLDKIKVDQAVPKWLAVTSARLAQRSVLRSRGMEEVSFDHPLFERWEAASLSPAVDTEDALILKEAIANLPEKCRDVIRALFFEGLSYGEAAERVGVAVGSLGSLQARCLQRMADAIASGGAERDA